MTAIYAFEYPCGGKIKLFLWFSPNSSNIDRSIDTMLRSILLLFVSRKPAIQGICPIGVFKILCIAGFFCVMWLLREFSAQGAI